MHNSMAYSVSNIYTKNYWNWTVIVKIYCWWLGDIFFETQCTEKYNLYNK